jgi:hypothetical protein
MCVGLILGAVVRLKWAERESDRQMTQPRSSVDEDFVETFSRLVQQNDRLYGLIEGKNNFIRQQYEHTTDITKRYESIVQLQASIFQARISNIVHEAAQQRQRFQNDLDCSYEMNRALLYSFNATLV